MDGMTANHPVTEQAAAERALMQGQIDKAVARFKRIAAANPNDGQTYLLLCRSFYAEEHADEAVGAGMKAVQTLPRSSEAQDWLGRAYGMKAESAGPIAGLTLALKVKAAFEAAVALDSRNGAAANDLSEFYIDAPSIIGGGLDKAVALADQVKAQLPQQAHRMRALTAEKRKDYGTAEREFKQAVEVANLPDAWADLGAYYQRRGQYDQAVPALKQCLAVDRVKDASVVDAASLLDRMHREQGVAEQALREYLASDAKSDAAPVIRVHVMLGKMLAGAGDKTGAKIEFDKALEMASGYAPAKQALQEL
jgi:tetratricopeptide (TPR) repeat protein